MANRTIGRKWLGLLSVVMLAVAACGSGGGGGNATPAAETQNPNAAKGGTLNLGVWQEPTTFLAAGITDSLTFSYLIDAPMAEGLLWYRSVDQTANAKSIADYWQPSLASEVPTTANGDVKTSGCSFAGAKMCVTWKLQKGVQWHDGSTFTSHDVCDTFQFYWLKYRDKNPTALLTTTGWDKVVDCQEKDKQTAVVSYKSTYGPYLALGSGVYGILPASYLDKAFAAGAATPDHAAANIETFKQPFDLSVGSKAPAAFKGSETLDLAIDGTGPYVFSSYTAGKELVLVRNQNYWNKAHQPHIDKLVFKIESDIPSELNAAKAGDIDMGFDYRLYNLQNLITETKNNKLALQTIPDSGAEHIDMNMCANAKGLCGTAAKKTPYTADKTIRRAILMSLNRKEIIDNQAAGKTIIPQDAWQYLGIDFAKDTSTNPQTPYDPTAAQKKLDDAGYKLSPNCDGGQTRAFSDGTCIDINLGTTSNNPSRVATESLIAGYLQKVGIHVNQPFTPNLTPGKFFGSFSDGGPLYTHNFDMAEYTQTTSAPAEMDSYYPGYHADCGGTCPADNQIPSAANKGQGQNSTGENNPEVDKAFDQGRNSIDLIARANAYKRAEQFLAQDLPDLPLYQQVTVNSYSVKLQDFKQNDLVWDFNSYDWYCTGGKCQA